MKKFKSIFALALCLAMALTFLTGCGGTQNPSEEGGVITVANSPDDVTASEGTGAPLAEASDFTFDFMTLDYSFTGVENAEFYYIKVYPVVDGEESNSASFQSDKISANDSGSYSGAIEGQILLAGDYIAHVVASASGYKSSDVQTSGTSTLLASASVTANWNTGNDPDITADITITPGDALTSSFTLTVTNEAGDEVYRNEAATAEPISLTAADLGAEALTTEDVYNVTVTVNPVEGYTLPAEGATTQITERRMFGPPM